MMVLDFSNFHQQQYTTLPQTKNCSWNKNHLLLWRIFLTLNFGIVYQRYVLVTFDGGGNMLPLYEICFRKIVLQEKPNMYEYIKNMDIALTHVSTRFSFA